MYRSIGLSVALVLLAGCASQPPVNEPPAPLAVASDPQQCDSRAECTSKTSRTLLFVFDYAAAGAPLVQRDRRLLFTPADGPVTYWPALYIRLAEAEQVLRSRMTFAGTTLRFSTEADDFWWWIMDSPDANAARMILAVLNRPAWQ